MSLTNYCLCVFFSLLLLILQYAPTVLQTIQNADGTVSIIQMDSSNPIITLPDGTTAQVQGVATVRLKPNSNYRIFILK